MTQKYSPWPWFGLGALAGLAGGLLLARRRSAVAVPNLDSWQREWAKTRGVVGAALLAGRIQARYAELYAQRPRFAQPALRDHLERHILPGLALYQTFREEAPTQEAALDETEATLRVSFQGMRRLLAALDKVPYAYSLFRGLAKLDLWLKFPDAGWRIEWVENSDRCIAFNIRDRCLYRDIFTAYGAPELTARFCALDDWMYSALPPTIRWERTTTLGRGDECCNFRYCRGAASPVEETVKVNVQQLNPVAQTLMLPLGYRALESRRPDALIHDPKAEEIMGQLAYDFSRIQREKFQALNVALRAREFDRAARAFLAAHPAGTIVEIGCGLDTRFDRLDNGQVRWFNLDFPEVIALREQFFAPQPRCHNLATSALDFAWLEAVAETGGPYLFLAEGVLPYFTEAEVRRLLQALQERFPGAEFVFDTMPALLVRFSHVIYPSLRQTRTGPQWGLADSRAPERWAPGLKLLADWRYYTQDEPRLGLYRYLRYVPLTRDFRILRYRLG